MSPGVLSPADYFMHACNRNFFFFQKCNLDDNCRRFFAGKVHFSVYGKVCVFVHCKGLCNLHGAVPEQTGHLIITRDA